MDSEFRAGSSGASRTDLSDIFLRVNMDQLSNKESRVVQEQDSSSDTNEDFEDVSRTMKNEITLTQTKEQKQKQNEEIVIMESSSVSSETGSWESVFPKESTSDQCENSLPIEANGKFSNGQSHFFIDASSLLDDIEYHAANAVENYKATGKVTKVKISHSDIRKPDVAEFYKDLVVENVHSESTPVEIKSNVLFTDVQPSTSTNVNASISVPKFTTDLNLNETAQNEEICKPVNSNLELWTENSAFVVINNKSPEEVWTPCEALKDALIDLEQLSMFISTTEVSEHLLNAQFEDENINTKIDNQIVDPDNLMAASSSQQTETYDNVSPSDKPVFVRSNTFELETREDETIERKNNERRQGSLLFQNSIHQYSGYTNSLSSDEMLPATPHNSIIQVQEPLVMNQSSDGPLNSLFYKPKVDNGSPTDIPTDTGNDQLDISRSGTITKKVIKRDETTPIVSGGVSTEDFKPVRVGSPLSQRKLESTPIVTGTMSPEDFRMVRVASPLTQRKIESTPIVTGAMSPDDFRTVRVASPLTQRKIESTPIVTGALPVEDFKSHPVGSPLTQRKIESTPIVTGIITDLTPEEKPKPAKTSVAAWVVDMSSAEQSLEYLPDTEQPTSSKVNHKSSLGFYVDLNAFANTETEKVEKIESTSNEAVDKKNIFSMVIDFEAPKKEMPSRLSQSLYSKKSEVKVQKSSVPTVDDKKIEKVDDKLPEPVVRRPRSSSNTRMHNRHSWNSSGDSDTSTLVHQRTYSIHEDDSTESHISLLKVDVPGFTKDCKITDASSSSDENKESSSMTENEDKVKEIKTENASDSGGFVRLSDLDKSIPKIITSEIQDTPRMTRSIPETSWIENKLLMSRSVGSRVTSSRLLPRMSASTPSSLHFPQVRSKSPGPDTDDMVSELSDLSSMHSSMVLEVSTEDTSQSSSYQPHQCTDRLGHDLLRMFLEEISPDVTVEVEGRRIKAHKCILSSRCQYFAAMLSGGWVESAGNIISLQGFSYQAVHFAMCHIYSGAADIPDSISLVELATLADMLGLEGLKEVVQYTLKLKHCHLFHKPCNVCVIGVLECLPLAAAYGLDELYRKALRWITRYFVRVWPTRSFSALPRELIEKCYQQHVVHMTADNVLETTLCCDKLLATLPNVRWAEVVHDLINQLADACQVYVMQHFSSVLASASFLSLGKEMSWNISRLEGGLVQATDKLSPEQACRSYARAHKLLSLLESGEDSWSPNFIELVRKLLNIIEKCVVRQAVRVSHTQSWPRLDIALRARIQDLCCFPLDRPRVSRQARSTSGSRNLDLRQVRLAMQQHTRRAQSSDSRKAITRSMQQPPAKPVEPPRPRTWPARVNPKTKFISSSDSSRTSSPALKRNSKRIETRVQKDGMSLDSLQSPVVNKNVTKAKSENKVSSDSTLSSQGSKVKQKPKVAQHVNQKQKTVATTQVKPKTGLSKSSIQNNSKEREQLSKSLPTVNKENRNVVKNQTKSGSSSSTQYSPSALLKSRQTNVSSPNSQIRTNMSPYNGSPSLRRSLLLAAKAPQVPVKPVSPATNKRLARIQANQSITSPTKSSAAKCVSSSTTSKLPQQKQTARPTAKKTERATVERSGTFLKDEPTVHNRNGRNS